MLVFGLTGGIGTGKSTVAQALRARGVPVIDADQVAREVVAPGSDGLAAIVARFGPDALDASGALDRRAMRERIVADPDARRALEQITHPRIAEAIGAALAARAAAGEAVAGVEAALMVETGSYQRYGRVVVVTCSPERQLARVIARDGGSSEAAAAIIATQLPMADKLAVATDVVHNDGDLDALEAQVAAVHATLLAAARSG